jgi:hypothetical protein
VIDRNFKGCCLTRSTQILLEQWGCGASPLKRYTAPPVVWMLLLLLHFLPMLVMNGVVGCVVTVSTN